MTLIFPTNPQFRYLLLLVLVIGIASAPSLALAAGSTTVTVMPAKSTGDTGETVTVDIVVDEATGGVGAWEMVLNLTNDNVADIESVKLHGDPNLNTVNIAEDQSSVYFDAALADTVDSGPVTIVTVTLKIKSVGETNLNLAIAALGDETGDSYSITKVTNATLSAGESSSSNGPTETESSDATRNSDQTPTEDSDTTEITDSGDDETEDTGSIDTASETDRTGYVTKSEGTATSASSKGVSAEGSTPGFTGLISLFSIVIWSTLLLRHRE